MFLITYLNNAQFHAFLNSLTGKSFLINLASFTRSLGQWLQFDSRWNIFPQDLVAVQHQALNQYTDDS